MMCSNGRRDRPVVPYYHDDVACEICGGDGHRASDCPFREQINCPACLGSGTVLACRGAASVVVSCEACEGTGRTALVDSGARRA